MTSASDEKFRPKVPRAGSFAILAGMFRPLALAFLVAVAVGWSAAILAAPRTRAATDGPVVSGLAATTYVIGAVVCHQRPERSFHVAGVRMPVCARCTALYLAGAAGLVAWLLVRSPRRAEREPSNPAPSNLRTLEPSNLRSSFTRALLVSGAPVVISLATGAMGLWDPPNAWRAAISAPLGLTLGAVLAAVTLEDLR